MSSLFIWHFIPFIPLLYGFPYPIHFFIPFINTSIHFPIYPTWHSSSKSFHGSSLSFHTLFSHFFPYFSPLVFRCSCNPYPPALWVHPSPSFSPYISHSNFAFSIENHLPFLILPLFTHLPLSILSHLSHSMFVPSGIILLFLSIVTILSRRFPYIILTSSYLAVFVGILRFRYSLSVHHSVYSALSLSSYRLQSSGQFLGVSVA